MKRNIIRLDDACEKRDVEKWNQMEALLVKYNIKPLVGVIPNCQDKMMNQYKYDENFWEKVNDWLDKGWEIAMHGCNHVYNTECGGINPVNKKSEFAGESLEIQREKIKQGYEIMLEHNIHPRIFFAPSHTFDNNTLLALKSETDIRVISDTLAKDIYKMNDFIFIPQQSGSVRNLPFKTTTFCYHPNTMKEEDFNKLEKFIIKNIDTFFFDYDEIYTDRKLDLIDILLKRIYMKMHGRNR